MARQKIDKEAERREILDEFLKKLAKDSGVRKEVIDVVYTSMKSTIVKALKQKSEKSIEIPGIGVLYVTNHKGHPLNLSIYGGNKRIDDYQVLKFQPNEDFKKEILGR